MRVRSRRAQERTPGKGEDAPRDFDGARVTAETPLDGRWLVRGKDGRLTAYARNEDGLLRWTEERPGGPGWEGPEFFPVPALTHLGLAQGADGYVHFVGRRVRDGADGTPRVDLVHAIQYQTGRPVTAWRTLGNPYKDGDERAARIGPCGRRCRPQRQGPRLRPQRQRRHDDAPRGHERQVGGVEGPQGHARQGDDGRHGHGGRAVRAARPRHRQGHAVGPERARRPVPEGRQPERQDHAAAR